MQHGEEQEDEEGAPEEEERIEEEAHREAYARVKTIIIPNMFYRTDIGFRWRHEGDLLHTWGLLT